MSVVIREMTVDDQDEVVALWDAVPGVEVTWADTHMAVADSHRRSGRRRRWGIRWCILSSW
jgi:hypothetical protein